MTDNRSHPLHYHHCSHHNLSVDEPYFIRKVLAGEIRTVTTLEIVYATKVPAGELPFGTLWIDARLERIGLITSVITV